MPPTLARKHLDKRLERLRPVSEFARPPRGWVRAIRDALGMTTKQMAQRLGVAQSRISALERAEVGGNVSIATMEKAAQALDCAFVYALVPRKSLDGLLMERARTVAAAQLARVDQTMRLENQAVDGEEMAAERDRLVLSLIEQPRRLWDET